MKLIVNGHAVELPDHVSSVQQILEHYELENRIVVVEVDAQIVEKHHFKNRVVDEGARIEIVHFVGGG
ncbi:sulfur carrier protein ThiS [Paenibacillus guangzhouensis]|uniref:sulfur carrier protein ThiS n=1 Tax=Paenibacillus guangzhouensis TaxID=1473112 RepID=UPI0012669959|nr:sulfur carrier protein ThiS [Paenibacillus guangzhouensis]